MTSDLKVEKFCVAFMTYCDNVKLRPLILPIIHPEHPVASGHIWLSLFIFPRTLSAAASQYEGVETGNTGSRTTFLLAADRARVLRGWSSQKMDCVQGGRMVSSTISPWKLQPGHKAVHEQNIIDGPKCVLDKNRKLKLKHTLTSTHTLQILSYGFTK